MFLIVKGKKVSWRVSQILRGFGPWYTALVTKKATALCSQSLHLPLYHLLSYAGSLLPYTALVTKKATALCSQSLHLPLYHLLSYAGSLLPSLFLAPLLLVCTRAWTVPVLPTGIFPPSTLCLQPAQKHRVPRKAQMCNFYILLKCYVLAWSSCKECATNGRLVEKSRKLFAVGQGGWWWYKSAGYHLAWEHSKLQASALQVYTFPSSWVGKERSLLGCGHMAAIRCPLPLSWTIKSFSGGRLFRLQCWSWIWPRRRWGRALKAVSDFCSPKEQDKLLSPR